MLITSSSDSIAQISTIISIWLARNTKVFKDTNIRLELMIDKAFTLLKEYQQSNVVHQMQ
jgi:hypothetical protein